MMCSSCGNSAPLREVAFGMHVGAVVVRFHQSRRGWWCSQCIHSTFWSFTLITLFCGWWGVISFLITPFILLGNVFNYCQALLTTPRRGDQEGPVILSQALVDALEPFRPEIEQRLRKGEALDRVAREVGDRVGAKTPQVEAFYRDTFHVWLEAPKGSRR